MEEKFTIPFNPKVKLYTSELKQLCLVQLEEEKKETILPTPTVNKIQCACFDRVSKRQCVRPAVYVEATKPPRCDLHREDCIIAPEKILAPKRRTVVTDMPTKSSSRCPCIQKKDGLVCGRVVKDMNSEGVMVCGIHLRSKSCEQKEPIIPTMERVPQPPQELPPQDRVPPPQDRVPPPKGRVQSEVPTSYRRRAETTVPPPPSSSSSASSSIVGKTCMCSVKARGNALCGAKAVVVDNGVAKCGRHKRTCLQHPSTLTPSGNGLEMIREEEEEVGPSVSEAVSEAVLQEEIEDELKLAMDALEIEEKEIELPTTTTFTGEQVETWRNTTIDPSQLEAFLFSTGESINEQVVDQFLADVDDCLLNYQ